MPVEIKICGCTNYDDAAAALDAGADYLGFVLYQKSPRYISPAGIAGIVSRLGGRCRAVGVFVNESRDFVTQIASDCSLHAVQLHGDEKPDDFRNLTVRIWRATWLKAGVYSPEPDLWDVDRYVLDAAAGGLYGGTGLTTDWQRAAGFAGSHSVMLAGGLNPDNVAGAVRTVRPLGVDVVSGVEAGPGRKDHAKVKAFIRTVRELAD